jgi:hypothetical protein
MPVGAPSPSPEGHICRSKVAEGLV